MNILGITLSRPSFNEITWTALIACIWWVAAIGIWQLAGGKPDVVDAGATLLIIFWGCLCPRCGIRIDRGLPHLFLNLVISALILTAFQGTATLFLH
jgi:hypothetical protein